MGATYAQFKSDPMRESVWLAEVSYYDTVGGTTGTLYFSTSAYGTAATDTPASQQYDARMANGYNFSAAIDEVGALGGMLPPRDGGSLVLLQSLGDLDYLRLYAFDGRAITIKHGGYSPVYGWVDYANFAVVFSGEGDGPALVGIDEVTIALRNKDARLEYPIQDRKYSGGTYQLYFDGAGDYVDCGATAAATAHLNFTSGDFTVEFYAYVESNPGATQRFLTRGLFNTDGWYVTLNSSGQVSLVTNQAGASQTTTSTAITLKKRVHVAIVRSGASVLIYFDGVLSVSASGTHVNPATCSRIFVIGGNDTHTALFVGFLDEIRVWNTARARGTVCTYMSRQLQAAEITSALKFYAKCDDGAGATLTDSSSGAVACTITGATWRPSLQGGEDMEGMPLPDVFGQREGFVPVLVDEQRLIYQVHSGSVYETTQVLVGGTVIAYDAAPGTTYTSMATFLAATTTAGFYERLVTQYGTWIRLGTAPNKPVTMTIKGDNTGGTGYGDASTYRTTAGAITRYIICNRGSQPLTDPTDLDTAAFTALDTANSAVCGAACYDEVTVAEVVSFLLRSIGAVGWFARGTGDFTALVFAGTASKTTVADFTGDDIEEGTLEAVGTGSPAWGVDLRFRRNDLVHSSTDIAVAVVTASPPPATANWRFLLSEWRTTSPRNAATRAVYNGAVVISLDTALQTYAAASVEASRLLGLYDQQGQCFRAFFSDLAVQIDRMDFVTLALVDGDEYNLEQARVGTSSAAIFVVLAIEDDAESGGTWLTLYREAIS